MGWAVFLIAPLYIYMVYNTARTILRFLANVFPGLRRKPDPEKLAAAREKGEEAAKRAAEPRVKKPIAIAFTAVFTLLSMLMPIGYFLKAGLLQKIFRRVGYFMLFYNMYFLMFAAVGALIGLILILAKVVSRDSFARGRFFRTVNCIVILGSLAFCIYGEFNARILKEKHYSMTIEKDGGDLDADENGDKVLKIALLGDLHIGYNAGLKSMQQVVEKVNKEGVDVVLIAGDIFDNQYDAIENPDAIAEALSGFETKYGVYACFGNHDVEDNLIFGFNFSDGKSKPNDSRYYDFLAKAGITILTDESTELIADSFYIVGRRDPEEVGLEDTKAKRKDAFTVAEGLDTNKLLIDLEHEPKEVDEVYSAGFDMQLCGHTHDGQFFPFNLICRLAYFNSCGYRVYLDFLHTVTTAGVGSYGPYMRTLTDSEVTFIDVTLSGSSAA